MLQDVVLEYLSLMMVRNLLSNVMQMEILGSSLHQQITAISTMSIRLHSVHIQMSYMLVLKRASGNLLMVESHGQSG